MQTAGVPRLQTARLTLREWRAEDIDAYAAMTANPEVMRFLDGAMDRGRSWRSMAAHAGHWALRGYGQWHVERTSDGEFLGQVGLWNPEGWPGLEIGWTLARHAWGSGYATEAAAAAMDWAWTVLDAPRLISIIDPENTASVRVAKRLGMNWLRGDQLDGQTVSIYGIERPASPIHNEPKAAGWRAVAIDEVEAIDWRGTGIQWRPLRHALDLDIVGISGYTAANAGDPVIERHTEATDGRGQQELYIVLRGRARFTLDGEVLDAPAGTLVRVDPEVQRAAVALTSDTAVLALGGESTFEPSASEWVERARGYLQSDPERAKAILAELEGKLPGDNANAVGRALLAVGAGDETGAAQIVSDLIAKNASLRSVLAADPDLGPVAPESILDRPC